MSSVRQAVVDAVRFLEGIPDKVGERRKSKDQSNELKNCGESCQNLYDGFTSSLNLLARIHACAISETSQRDDNARIVFDIPTKGVICQLLEIAVLLGIQPYLSSGMGVPLHQRIRLQISPSILEWIRTEVHITTAGQQLPTVVRLLLDVIEGPGKGIEPIMRDHILPDLVYGLAELSYSPIHNRNGAQAPSYVRRLQNLLNVLPAALVLPIVTTLITPSTPGWTRTPLLDYISTIPLRPHGVRSVIDFVALSTSSPATYDPDASTQQGSSLTPEVLAQISKLIAAVPTSVTPEAYYSALSTQLFEMLDGGAGTDLAKVAASIIGSGILGRKSIGAPGTVGWSIFAEPLLEAINPTKLSIKESHLMNHAQRNQKESFRSLLTAEEVLDSSLNRLLLIIRSTPNAGLTKRLLTSLFQPLWGLHNYAFWRAPNSIWATVSWNLLQIYTSRCSNQAQLAHLAFELLWDGPSYWQYSPGSAGGIEIRMRSPNPQEDAMMNLVETMSIVESRVTKFVDLLSAGSVEPDTIGNVFLQVSKHWLLPQGTTTNSLSLLDLEDTSEALKSLVNASLVRAMLGKFEDIVSKNGANVLVLIEQVLRNYTGALDAEAEKLKGLDTPSYKTLNNIATQRSSQETPQSSNDTKERILLESESIASVGLSLLSTVLTSPESTLNPSTINAMAAIVTRLDCMLQHKIPEEMATSARALKSLASITTGGTSSGASEPVVPQVAPSAETDRLEENRTVYRQALENLTNDHPAIRSEALFMLRSLISPSVAHESATKPQDKTLTISPIIDTASTTYLLMSMLQDPEEFVYLSAISTLVALASCQPRRVLGILAQSYSDKVEERSLDERLRIGEALTKTLGELDDPRAGKRPVHLGHELRHSLAQQFVSVAGRRGKRLREAAHNQQERVRRDQEAKKMWGGEVPDVSNLLIAQEDDEEGELQRHRHDTRILDGWQGKHAEEDVRMRSSAVMLLGKILHNESNEADVLTCLDLATQILALETGDEKALLRRASALLLLEILRSDASRAHVPLSKMQETTETLERINTTDLDDIVRGHISVLLEEIAERHVIRVTTEPHTFMQSEIQLPEGKLAGLLVNPQVSGGLGKNRLIEEIAD